MRTGGGAVKLAEACDPTDGDDGTIVDPRQDMVGYYDWLGDRARRFDDRRHAGAVLADHLERYRGTGAVVLGIPRGGVPVADEVARRLGLGLDVIVARKLGSPGHEELAIGAVTSTGARFLNDEIIDMLRVPRSTIDRLTELKRDEARQREKRFRAGRPPLDLEGRVAIVVDDGLATGATTRAAIRGLRAMGAGKIVVAVPVGSAEACDAIAAEVDELVCPERPEPFLAVGAHYASFEQTTDEEVEAIVTRYAREPRAS